LRRSVFEKVQHQLQAPHEDVVVRSRTVDVTALLVVGGVVGPCAQHIPGIDEVLIGAFRIQGHTFKKMRSQ